MAILQLILSSFWTWLGFVVMVLVVSHSIVEMFSIISQFVTRRRELNLEHQYQRHRAEIAETEIRHLRDILRAKGIQIPGEDYPIAVPTTAT